MSVSSKTVHFSNRHLKTQLKTLKTEIENTDFN